MSRPAPHIRRELPPSVASRSAVRLGLLVLMAIALVLLPVISGEHHARTHVDQVSVEHVHAADQQPCTQDHAADADCAAMSNCPVCTLRHTKDNLAAPPPDRGFVAAMIDRNVGYLTIPDIRPPRISVAA